MTKNEKLRDKVYDFMHYFKAASLATADRRGKPQAATVYCTVDTNLNIYFVTRTAGRKYSHIIQNPHVAMIVTDEESLRTVQLSGKAEVIDARKIEQDILAKLWRFRFDDLNWPMPPIKIFEARLGEELSVIKITPKELTFANFENSPEGHYQSYYEKII